MDRESVQQLIPQIMEQYGSQLNSIISTHLQQIGIDSQDNNQLIKQSLLRAPVMKISQEHHDSLCHMVGMDPQQSHAPSIANIGGPSVQPPDSIPFKIFDVEHNPDEVMMLSAIMISAASNTRLNRQNVQ